MGGRLVRSAARGGVSPLLGAPSLACSEQLRAVRVIDPHVAVSPVLAAPAQRCLHGGFGGECRLDEIEGERSCEVLSVEVAGSPARVSERQVGEDEARNSALFDDVTSGSDDDRRDACGFEVTCDQTHGLMADRSKGNKDDDVDVVFLAPCENLGGIGSGRSLRVLGRYAEDSIVDCTDAMGSST